MSFLAKIKKRIRHKIGLWVWKQFMAGFKIKFDEFTDIYHMIMNKEHSVPHGIIRYSDVESIRAGYMDLHDDIRSAYLFMVIANFVDMADFERVFDNDRFPYERKISNMVSAVQGFWEQEEYKIQMANMVDTVHDPISITTQEFDFMEKATPLPHSEPIEGEFHDFDGTFTADGFTDIEWLSDNKHFIHRSVNGIPRLMDLLDQGSPRTRRAWLAKRTVGAEG